MLQRSEATAKWSDDWSTEFEGPSPNRALEAAFHLGRRRPGRSSRLSGRSESLGHQISRKPFPIVAPMEASSAQFGAFRLPPSAKASFPSNVLATLRATTMSYQFDGTK